MKDCLDKIFLWLYKAGNIVIGIAGSLILVILSWYSLRYTQYMKPFEPEFPINRIDSMGQNLLILFLAMMLLGMLALLEKKSSLRIQVFMRRVVFVVMVTWIAAASFWWICAAERMPGSDQFYICWDASNFMKGEFASLLPGYYCERYPQQLGMTALLEIFFTMVGPNNYFAFEVLSAFLAVGIAILGYLFIREITDNFVAASGYCIMMSFCFPLIFYTSWVYGEIPSVFCSFFAMWLALRYLNRKKVRYLVGVVAFLSIAKLCRENAVILMIAFGITALLYSIVKKDRRLLIAAICAVLVPNILFSGIQQMYEIRSGIPKSDGIQKTAGIAVGLMENYGRYGWDCGYEGEVYNQVSFDKEKANAIYLDEIRNRLQIFRESPDYAVTFFREKQLSQWNAPLCQSYYFSLNYKEDNYPQPDSFVMRLSTDYFQVILFFCDRLQFILFIGVLFYILLAVRKNSNMLHHVFIVAVIGGFLFTAIWEAKARYVFSYYIMMFPMAAIGYSCLLIKLSKIRKKGNTL